MSEKIADVIKETENNKADRQEQYFFRTDQLTVGYDGKPLIREINIQLKKGEILTLIGPNGAGKSTILKSITRQLATISGTVYLDKEKMEQGVLEFADYNEIRVLAKNPELMLQKYQNVTRQIYENAKIIHYLGNTKPWSATREQSRLYEMFDEAYEQTVYMMKNDFL